MTHYLFDELIDRRGTLSAKYKWFDPDVLPAWVADMDFRAPPAVLAALRAQVEHGIYGYDFPDQSVLGAVVDRMARLYGWSVAPEAVVAVPGLVSGFSAAARAVCQPGDGYLVQTPVYHPMLNLHQVTPFVRHDAPLTPVADAHTFRYEVDLAAFEAAIQPATRMFLACHPHNPTGKVFTRAELTGLAEACQRHNLVICSDEIHSELLLGALPHIPFAALAPEIAQQTITLIAPSKTFNIAGLFCGFALIPNPDLRRRFQTVCQEMTLHVAATGLVAARAAFGTETDEWLADLRAYLTANRDLVVKFVAERLPGVRTTVPDATYLAWLDCRDLRLEPSPYEFFLQQARVAFNDGALFGPGGEGCVRLNFGCPRATLVEMLERMERAVRAR